MLIVDKDQKTRVMIDVAISSDSNKTLYEKPEKNQGLKEDLERM